MDEIDAALDFKNVSIVANYIKVSCFCIKYQCLFCVGRQLTIQRLDTTIRRPLSFNTYVAKLQLYKYSLFYIGVGEHIRDCESRMSNNTLLMI